MKKKNQLSLDSVLRRLAQNKKQMSEEMNDLEKKLHKEKKDKETKSSKMRQIETELRESKSEMSQKGEMSELFVNAPDYLKTIYAVVKIKVRTRKAIKIPQSVVQSGRWKCDRTV